MLAATHLPREFYNCATPQVAKDLLGMRLVHIENGQRLAGIIQETEAYQGEEDLGCHARVGRTQRTQVMYGQPGHAYVYFTYGMHWMLNFVTEEEGFPAAVLIRSLKVTEGVDFVTKRRGNQLPNHWTDGPAKLCRAFGIDGKLNGCDLCAQDAQIFVESNHYGRPSVEQFDVTVGPRVGLNNVIEPWKSIPWRFRVRELGIKS